MSKNEELTSYVAALKKADVQDDGAFHTLLGRGIGLLQLLDKDLAREFGVSRPTVSRWRNGVNAPHPAMRKPVYAWLERRAAAFSKRSETAATPPTRAAAGAAAPA